MLKKKYQDIQHDFKMELNSKWSKVIMHDVKCLRWVYRLNSNIFSTKHINGLIPRMINKSKKIEK